MKRDNSEVIKGLIDKMFELAGHNLKYEDVVGRQDSWFQQYTMTQEQNEQWRKWGVEFLRKKKRWSKYLAEREIAMLDLYCGLKIENSVSGSSLTL